MARGYPEIDLPVGCEPTDNIWEAMFTQRAIRYWQDLSLIHI